MRARTAAPLEKWKGFWFRALKDYYREEYEKQFGSREAKRADQALPTARKVLAGLGRPV